MKPHDISIYEAWMNGLSVGAIAKNHKLDKSYVKKVINRVSNDRPKQPEVLQQLHDDQTLTGGQVQSV